MRRWYDAAWRAADRSGLNALVRRSRRGRLLIVCYHGIVADACDERHWLLMRRRTFARQLEYLRRHFRVVALDEALAELRAGALHDPSVAITFDDGYRNNYTVAWPELNARGLPATIFLTTGAVGTNDTLWTTTLEYAFRNTKAGWCELHDHSGPRLRLSSASERESAGTIVKARLKELPAAERREEFARLMDTLGPTPPVPHEFALMSWDEVRELGASGLVRFGAHTVSHEIVSRLDDHSLERELAVSLQSVDALGRAASRVFAYPNGRRQDYDARATRLLQSLGAKDAVTTIGGTNSRRTPRFSLRRLVLDEAMPEVRFAAEASGLAAFARDALTRDGVAS